MALALSAAALMLSACAVGPLLPYEPDAVLTVTLPLARVGLRDERAAFATVFERELRTTPAEARVGDWLHTPPAAPLALDQLDRRFEVRRAGVSVLVVPGLFGDCVEDQSVPFGDGTLRSPDAEAVESYRSYDDLGLRGIRMLRLPGRASSAHNGERIAQAVRAEAARPDVEHLVLVAYSKGVADALHALELLQVSGRAPAKLAALVSVAGTVMGSPLADHFEGLYEAVSPRVSPLSCSAAEGGELASITRRERVRWLASHALPEGPAYYSIAAYASAAETAPALRWPQAMLARIDPRNDGQVLVADALLPGSTLLATARADHWDVALPRDRHPDALVRGLASGRHYPREALFRATLRWVIGQLP